MHHVRTLLTFLAIAVLAACAGPTTPPPPPDPTVSGVAPDVAARGESIVVTGTDFGTSGTLTVGGVEATITDWSDTQVEATVAPGTPSGWQDVVLSTADGTDDFSPFFVGVEFDGTAGELQAFLDGLAKGTAVLLQAETYDLSASTDGLIVDNHGLYGRGETQTTLEAPLGPGMIVLADFGENVTLADMSIESDATGFFHGTVADVIDMLGTSAVATLPATLSATRSITLPSWSTTIEVPSAASAGGPMLEAAGSTGQQTLALASSPTLTLKTLATDLQPAIVPADATPPQVTLRNVAYSDVAGGYIGIPLVLLPYLDLTVVDTTIDAPDSMVALFSSQDVTVERAEVTGGAVQLLSFSGSVSVIDSTVESTTDLMVGAESGILVDGSTLRALDGSMQIVGAVTALMGGSTVPTGGPIEIVGSTVEALDDNLADATVNGDLQILTQFAPIVLTDNVLVRSHDSMTFITQESAIGEGDITLSGNLNVQAGVFKAEDAVNFRPAALTLVSTGGGTLPDTITLDGSTIAATAVIQVVAGSGATPGVVMAHGSAVSAGDGENNGVIQLVAGTPGWVELDGNTFEADAVVALVAPDLMGKTAVLTDNVVSVVGTAAPQFVAQVVGGSCEASGNTITVQDADANNATVAYLFCVGADPSTDTFTVTGNTLSATGGGTSIAAVQATNGTLAMSSNQIATEAAFQLAANAVTGVVSDNTLQLQSGYWLVSGDATSDLTLDANIVTHEDVTAYGLALSGVGSTTVTNNSFTDTGTPAATSVAFVFAANAAPITLDASGNTFTNFGRALYVLDQNGAAWGIDATLENNVFDFTIDAAPEVAELENVASEIDARNNQWGANTDATTVESYVTLSGDTAVQGGSILLDPITLP